MLNENNNGRPQFDSLTGLPIIYNDDPVEETHDDVVVSEEDSRIESSSNESSSNESDLESGNYEDLAATEENTDSQYRYSSGEIPYSSTIQSSSVVSSTDFGIKQVDKATKKAEQKAAKKAAKSASHSSTKNSNRSNSRFKKVFKLVVASVMCGIIAGVTMYGVLYTGLYYLPTNQVSSENIEIATLGTTVKNNGTSSDSDMNIATTYMDVPNVVKTAMPAVVALSGTVSTSSSFSYNPFSTTPSQASTSGTGIIIGKNDTELLIVTNAHVVDGVSNLKVSFIDEELVNATVKGSKSDKDIAVVAVHISDIKASTIKSIAIAELGHSDEIQVGESVVAIGNALGEGQSVTVGWISALNRSITIENTEYSNLIMTDAAINPGNSGGALLNANGMVIGINSAKYASEEVEGMGYAIPISSVKDIIDNLVTKQTRSKVSSNQKAEIGIKGMDITSSISSKYGYPKGVQIRQVISGSAAESAGLVIYDIIVSFDGEDIDSFQTLSSLCEYYAAGEKVEIGYYHMENGSYVLKQVQVTLGKSSSSN